MRTRAIYSITPAILSRSTESPGEPLRYLGAQADIGEQAALAYATTMNGTELRVLAVYRTGLRVPGTDRELYGTAGAVGAGRGAVAAAVQAAAAVPLLEHGHDLLAVVGHVAEAVVGIQQTAVRGLQRVDRHPAVGRL